MDCEAIRTWATVAAAVGTVGAVVYALYRDLILANRRRPRLDLRFSPGGSDQVIVQTLGGTDAAYVRLRVTNEKGKDSADDVQVLVTDVTQRDASSEATPIGLPLIWSGSFPSATVASVHPGVERHVDFLHVNEPPAKDELEVADRHFKEVPVELDVHPKPAGDQHLLAAGKYDVRVEVLARNADASRYTISVEWDGKWPRRDTLWQALRVQPPKKQ